MAATLPQNPAQKLLYALELPYPRRRYSKQPRERFEILRTAIERFPSSVNRNEVYEILFTAVATRRCYEMVTHAWCRRRDRAIEKVRKAIEEFRNVMDELGPDVGAKWAGDLEAAYARTTDDPGEGHNILHLTPETYGLRVSPEKGGRPPAPGKAEADQRLKSAGVTQEIRRHLLKEAGLSEAIVQRPKQSRKRPRNYP